MFPLGTDNLGRDLLSRLLQAARLSIGMAALATVTIVAVAITIGCLAGYLGGWFDALTMRLADVVLAFPGLILALAIVGTLGIGLFNVILSIALVSWAGYARLVRGLVLEVREEPYVEAALAIGASRPRIVLKHIIPNVISPVIVLVSLEMGSLILAIAGLNFLGLGAQPPTAEWGAMLNQGRLFFQSEPQLMIYPGVMIGLSVLGFNLLGDGLRDILDPRYIR
jgi:peptide/nickel transport system permease protein